MFYGMREDLEIEPANFYFDYSQMKDKRTNTFLYMQNGTIIGAVSCYGTELDDLTNAISRKGVRTKTATTGLNHIKEQGYVEIILHVAEWNQNAVKLYLKNGFSITKKERVREN